MAHYRSIRDFDWPLLILTIAICSLGILQIFSATHDTGWREAWWKQIVWVLVGLLAMWLMTMMDYHTLLAQAPIMYLVAVLALLATFLVGRQVFGSTRWIRVGGFTFQISEFMKLVIVLLVARYMTEVKGERLEARDLLKLGGLVGLPMLLVLI